MIYLVAYQNQTFQKAFDWIGKSLHLLKGSSAQIMLLLKKPHKKQIEVNKAMKYMINVKYFVLFSHFLGGK